MQVSSRQSTCDVAVVGAGVFGAWIAYQLRRSGQRVILIDAHGPGHSRSSSGGESRIIRMGYGADEIRSEEHTSELQSLTNLVCRLLLEKKKKNKQKKIKIKNITINKPIVEEDK